MKALKSKKAIALITNFDHPPYIYDILSKYQLKTYFDFIAISGEMGIRKPNPEIFHIALNKLGLNPNEVVLIGDSKEDIQGAKNASIKPILIHCQSSKKFLIGNDYFSNKITKNLNLEFQNKLPWKTVSNLRDLYELLF